MGHTGVLDGAVEVEAAAEAEAEGAPVTTVDDAGAGVVACPVAVDPVARVAAGVGVGVPCAFSFCARLVALPKPRNLPIIPPPGVPGVAAPFPLGPLPFPVAVPVPLPAPAFVPVLDPLSSGVVGTAAAAAAAVPGPAPLETEARRVGAGTSSFCATAFDVAAVLAVVEPPPGPWTGCED
jgi:hypothetical protein